MLVLSGRSCIRFETGEAPAPSRRQSASVDSGVGHRVLSPGGVPVQVPVMMV